MLRQIEKLYSTKLITEQEKKVHLPTKTCVHVSTFQRRSKLAFPSTSRDFDIGSECGPKLIVRYDLAIVSTSFLWPFLVPDWIDYSPEERSLHPEV